MSINDDDREDWVNNDESLYLKCERYLSRHPRRTIGGFVCKHRGLIDAVIARTCGR